MWVVPKRAEMGLYAEMYAGMWRIFNGAEWVHGFETEEEAEYFARKWSGTAIGKAKYNEQTGFNDYEHVRKIKGADIND